MELEEIVKDIPLRNYEIQTRIDLEPERNNEIA